MGESKVSKINIQNAGWQYTVRNWKKPKHYSLITWKLWFENRNQSHTFSVLILSIRSNSTPIADQKKKKPFTDHKKDIIYSKQWVEFDYLGKLQHLENTLKNWSYFLQPSSYLDLYTHSFHRALFGLMGEREERKNEEKFFISSFRWDCGNFNHYSPLRKVCLN